MKPIQNQYQDLLEGKMSKFNFLTNIKRTLPDLVSNITSLEDAVKILKNKRILSESIHNTPQMGGVTTSKGIAGYINNPDKKGGDYDPKARAANLAKLSNFGLKKEEDTNYDFIKNAIESASGDKVEKREEDEEGNPLYWSLSNDNVNYYIGSDEQIIKYNGETGERYPIGELEHYKNSPDDKDYDEEIVNRYEREQEKHALPGGHLKESIEMPANLISDIDKVNPLEYRSGLDYELDLTGDFSAESLVKCAKKVVKNLKKNPIYYTNLKAELTQKINNKKVVSSEYTELKKDNQVDKLNQLKSIVKKEIANTKTSLSKQEKASKAMPKGVKLMKEDQNNESVRTDEITAAQEKYRAKPKSQPSEYKQKTTLAIKMLKAGRSEDSIRAKVGNDALTVAKAMLDSDLYMGLDEYGIAQYKYNYKVGDSFKVKNIQKDPDIPYSNVKVGDEIKITKVWSNLAGPVYGTNISEKVGLNEKDIAELTGVSISESKEQKPKLSAKLIQGIIQKSGGPRSNLFYTEDLKDGNVHVISKNQGMYDLVGAAKNNIEKYFDIQEESEKLEDRYRYEYFIKPNPSKPKSSQPKADIDLNTDDIFENNEKERQEKDFSKFSEKMIGKKSTAQNTIKDKIKTYVANSLKKEAVKFTIGNEKEYVSDAESRGFEDKLRRAGVRGFTKSKI